MIFFFTKDFEINNLFLTYNISMCTLWLPQESKVIKGHHILVSIYQYFSYMCPHTLHFFALFLCTKVGIKLESNFFTQVWHVIVYLFNIVIYLFKIVNVFGGIPFLLSIWEKMMPIITIIEHVDIDCYSAALQKQKAFH